MEDRVDEGGGVPCVSRPAELGDVERLPRRRQTLEQGGDRKPPYLNVDADRREVRADDLSGLGALWVATGV
jgi:hypothetical protein